MPRHAAAQLEGEQPAVELERGVEVADLERDVVDADQPGGAHISASSPDALSGRRRTHTSVGIARAGQPPPMPMRSISHRQTHGGSFAHAPQHPQHPVALGVILIVLPAALSDGHERSTRRRPPPWAAGVRRREEGRAQGRKRAQKVTYVFKGTFNVADSSVTSSRATSTSAAPASSASTVVFDLSAARVVVADNNGDGKRDAADLQDGDKVLVQARLPRREPGAAPFAARKLVDQSHETEGEDAPEHHQAEGSGNSAGAGSTPAPAASTGHYPVAGDGRDPDQHCGLGRAHPDGAAHPPRCPTRRAELFAQARDVQPRRARSRTGSASR